MRSSLTELTLDDFSAHPIWLIDPKSRAVYPSEAKTFTSDERTDNPEPVEVVYTRFDLADGSNCWGYCSPWDPSGIDSIQPVIIWNGQHLPLYSDETGINFDAACLGLGKSRKETFPMKFQTMIPGPDGIFQMTIENRP